jgi:hypothetical protein
LIKQVFMWTSWGNCPGAGYAAVREGPDGEVHPILC